jgi:hypothetical protein
VIKHYLRCFTGEEQIVWPKLLRIAEFCCNSHKNAIITVSLIEALMGYNPLFYLRDEAVAGKKEMPEVGARLKKLSKLREKLTTY